MSLIKCCECSLNYTDFFIEKERIEKWIKSERLSLSPCLFV